MTDFDKNTWRTPRYFFNWLFYRFSWFHVDGCADEHNSLCHHWIGSCSEDYEGDKVCIASDFLADSVFQSLLDLTADTCDNVRIFVNPPYSEVTPLSKSGKMIKKVDLN